MTFTTFILHFFLHPPSPFPSCSVFRPLRLNARSFFSNSLTHALHTNAIEEGIEESRRMYETQTHIHTYTQTWDAHASSQPQTHARSMPNQSCCSPPSPTCHAKKKKKKWISDENLSRRGSLAIADKGNAYTDALLSGVEVR